VRRGHRWTEQVREETEVALVAADENTAEEAVEVDEAELITLADKVRGAQSLDDDDLWVVEDDMGVLEVMADDGALDG
jgi:hypothetical protein